MHCAHRVEPGKRLSLDDLDSADTGSFSGKDDPAAVAQMERDIARLVDAQQRLYAEQRQSLLVVIQAMDTAGKDGVLRHVVGPLDSRGLHVWSFREPSSEEIAHDFLWRYHLRSPRRGEMAFFNRSYYEDVLVVRVDKIEPERVWRPRYDHIRAFERLMTDRGTRVVKFYLHISKSEQKRRLQERVDDPKKHWKFDPRDLEARGKWSAYRKAYEDAISETSTDEAPWYVVPADHKWYRDLAVAQVLARTLDEMKPAYPETAVDFARVRID
jgi:PPK2 family polyphosphate:nucleotide phosphotransferase